MGRKGGTTHPLPLPKTLRVQREMYMCAYKTCATRKALGKFSLDVLSNYSLLTSHKPLVHELATAIYVFCFSVRRCQEGERGGGGAEVRGGAWRPSPVLLTLYSCRHLYSVQVRSLCLDSGVKACH